MPETVVNSQLERGKRRKRGKRGEAEAEPAKGEGRGQRETTVMRFR